VTLDAYMQPGVLEGTVNGSAGEIPAAMVLGIAFCDRLIHGWDLATASGQDATMPADLVAAAWPMLDGRISDGDRGPGKSFAPAIAVPDGAQLQDKLLAYCGRSPSR
jgi:uncharacterized protein (TIGR03086 family)